MHVAVTYRYVAGTCFFFFDGRTLDRAAAAAMLPLTAELSNLGIPSLPPCFSLPFAFALLTHMPR